VVQRLIATWLSGQEVPRDQAIEASKQFETGHVCRHCESQLLRVPGSDYYWCATCGSSTHGKVETICVCGAHVGKHDALLRCAVQPGWANELNYMIRRKVAVVPRPQPAVQPLKYRKVAHELLDEHE